MTEEKNGTLNDVALPNDAGKLHRVMGFWDLVAFGITFMFPSIVLSYIGSTQINSHGHSFLAWVIASTIMICTALGYSKMTQAYPVAGSAYVFVARTYNNKLGFVVGWTLLIDYILTPLFVTGLFGAYLARIAPFLPYWFWITVGFGIVFIVNYVGLQIEKYTNNLVFFFQVLIVVMFAIMTTVFIVKHGEPIIRPDVVINSDFEITGLLTACTLAMLSFLGFDGISTIAEEAKISPSKTGKAIVTAVVIQALCLCATAYFASIMLPNWSDITDKMANTIAVDLQTAVGGETFATVVIVFTQVFYLTCSIVCTTSGSRLLYAMGRDNVLPNKVFGYLHPKWKTPVWSIVFILAPCYIGCFFLSWDFIGSVVSFGAMVAFFFVNASVITHYWKRQRERKVIRNLIIPLVAMFGIVMVVVLSGHTIKIFGGCWMLAGIVYMVVMLKKSPKFKDAVNAGKLNM